MVRGDRVHAAEFACRVNAAAALLESGSPTAAAVRAMAESEGVSLRQARRYVEQAMAGRVVVPEANVVFTVKLPGSLATRVRERARGGQSTISAVVAQALDEFLAREGSATPPR
jgi:predicted transcriptional regulator